MKKIILALAIAAAASMTIVGYASAGVERCDASAPVTVKTATFTMIQPANAYEQWSNVWTHDFTVTVADDNTFSGTGVQTGKDANYPNGYTAEWKITGKFLDGDKVSLVATRPVDGLVLTLNDETMGDDIATVATHNINAVLPPIEEKVSAAVTEVVTTPGESVKNHGQFVKAQGGGKIAAQACAGMPLNSTQGK